jgi:hypothetical protein
MWLLQQLLLMYFTNISINDTIIIIIIISIIKNLMLHN